MVDRMVIRAATEADIPKMHQIRMAVQENRLTDPGSVQPEDYQALMRDGGRGWVAELGGRMVGFAMGDRPRSNVWALFVDPAFEGRGAGRRLHDPMLEWLFSAGADRVWLSTDPGTRAETFYRAAGWRHAGDRENGEARYEMTRERWLGRE